MPHIDSHTIYFVFICFQDSSLEDHYKALKTFKENTGKTQHMPQKTSAFPCHSFQRSHPLPGHRGKVRFLPGTHYLATTGRDHMCLAWKKRRVELLDAEESEEFFVFSRGTGLC